MLYKYNSKIIKYSLSSWLCPYYIICVFVFNNSKLNKLYCIVFNRSNAGSWQNERETHFQPVGSLSQSRPYHQVIRRRDLVDHLQLLKYTADWKKEFKLAIVVLALFDSIITNTTSIGARWTHIADPGRRGWKIISTINAKTNGKYRRGTWSNHAGKSKT